MSKFSRAFELIKNPKELSNTLFFHCVRMGFYRNMPDEKYLKNVYKRFMGKELDLENPKTYNEKLQWLKLYDRKPIYTTMVDKCDAKKYVADIIGEEHIIPTLGVWDRFDDIDFDALPEQFVLKCTHDSGGLAICKNKAIFNKETACKRIKKSLKRNFYWLYREWPYKNVKPRILAEQYMDDGTATSGLTDYKFFCFNGTPELLYVSQGLENHSTAKISFYGMDGKEMPFHRSDFKTMDKDYKMPANFDDMKQIVIKIAAKIESPFVRIDLYSVHGKIYFSEITFFPCSGLMPIEPKEWDGKLGEWIKLPNGKTTE